MTVIGQEGYMILSDQIQLVLRVSRSISQSELHDLEQILRANFCTFFKCLDVLNVWVPDWTSILHVWPD